MTRLLLILIVFTAALLPSKAQDSGKNLLDSTVTGGVLSEAVVSTLSPQSRVSEVQVGVQKIDIKQMVKTPMLFGERDIMKSLQLLPGITSEGDGTSGLQVRGGLSSQNLVLMDGMTIYNSGHLLGFFSAFNDDALASATLYKGMNPAQFGGGTSAVLDIATKNGDMRKYHVDGTVGLLSANVSVDGPIVKDKLSFLASIRRSYADLFLNFLKNFRGDKLNFYDANVKLCYKPNEKDTFTASFFSGRDKLGIVDVMDFVWRNNTVSGRWNHVFNDDMNLNVTVAASNYGCGVGMEIMSMDGGFDGFIKQVSLKAALNWNLGSNSLNMGYQTSLYRVKTAEWTNNEMHEKELRNAWENSVWVNDDWTATDNLTISVGLRLGTFTALGGGSPYYTIDSGGNVLETLNYRRGSMVKTYFFIEPRISMNYRFSPRHSLKLGYSRNDQNIHAVRNFGMSMPFDRYTMTSNVVRPQISDQVSLGYIGLTNNEMFEFSADVYYKAINHVYDYKDGMTFITDIRMETLIEGGRGRDYGLEVMIRKNAGRFTGWISYTLAWAQNKIDGINNNRWYLSSNDRRHDISVVLMYSLTKTWDVSATWVFNTGQALTAPSGKYDIGGETYFYYSERNGYKAPDYHRLDIGFTNTKVKRRYTRQWSFGVYNLYNRYNPFMIMYSTDDNSPTGTKTTQYSLFGIIPSFAYRFIF